MAEPISSAKRTEHYSLDSTGITLRHIKQGTGGSSPGAREVLGVWYYPDAVGLNGKQGFQGGNYEPKLSEEGQFTLRFANSVGQDGILHRERFDVVSKPEFRPGDEFIEIWRGKELLFVGVPVSYNLGFSDVTISGYSAFWLLKKTREKAAGYWANAPRDVLEHYLSMWQMLKGDDFSSWSGTFSKKEQTTSDGRWIYSNVKSNPTPGGPIILVHEGALPFVGAIKGSGASFPGFPVGVGSTNPHVGVRAEAQVTCNQYNKTKGPEADYVKLVVDITATLPLSWGIELRIEANGIWIKNAEFSEFIKTTISEGRHNLAIELRDRWIYFYVDGKLVGTFPGVKLVKGEIFGKEVSIAGVHVTAGNELIKGSATTELHMLMCQRQRQFLFNPAAPGDYALPGAPVPTGLEGHYHLDQDIWAGTAASEIKIERLLHPTREIDPASSETGGLYQRRVDPVINFPTATPPAWQPSGPPNGEFFSCRWIGSVYLDFNNYDYALRATCDDRVRVYIGQTRLGEEYILDWTEAGHGMTTTVGNWLKAGNIGTSSPSGSSGKLAGQKSGWYPIVIEYSQGSGAGGAVVEYTRSDGIGAWNFLGSPTGNFATPVSSLLKLSPLGLFQDNIQFESHYEAFQKIIAAFGYQWLEVPQSLESGLFPGYVSPVTRVGRDTEYVLDSLEATEVVNQGNADDVADAILAEAQGLGDPGQNTQLTLEEFDFSAEGGLYLAQEQESLSDLNLEALVKQRADSLLALHNSVWEEVGARPRGKRALLDRFPLIGVLAEFKWDPGDGIRLDFPQVNVVDISPRQIQSVAWPVTPDGLGVPTASFKERPRNLKTTLRKMLQASMASQRNYQGQLVKVNGTIGGNSGGQSADAFSRCSLPADLSHLVKATLVVQFKGDASEWTIEVNGVSTGVKFKNAGRYDITPWVTRDGTNPRCYVRGVPGTGTIEVQVELLIVR